MTTSGDRQQRAAELVSACQLTAKGSSSADLWQIKRPAPQPASQPRSKLELPQPELQKFVDLLLTPEDAPERVKVNDRGLVFDNQDSLCMKTVTANGP